MSTPKLCISILPTLPTTPSQSPLHKATNPPNHTLTVTSSQGHQPLPPPAAIPTPPPLPSQPKPTNLNTSQPKSSTQNPAPQYFSKWSRKSMQSVSENFQVVSLYIENIPLRWLPIDIHLMMSKFGDILDVFVPRRLNKKGVRFSFVRFRNNLDTESTIRSINAMSVDGTHLVASVARKRRSEISPPKVQRHIAPDVNLNARISNTRSFSDVVRAPQNPPQAYIPMGRAQTWLQRSIFGVLKAPMPISKLREAFASFNLSDFNIIPLGGVSFLFRFQRIDDMMDFLDNKPEFIDYLFNFVSTRIGTKIDWSMDTKSGDRLEVAEILILTPNKKFIDTVISVKVGDKDCVIGTAESQYNPLDWEWSSVQSTGAACIPSCLTHHPYGFQG
ncbi:hypothetical protein Tsubulata_019406 [Turnera subulata]|uniref:RRM domain-containing protein n=1 Tax=Turnera subulata TaxID=218843 RepID=A0A9Q0JRP8_9ROSI|nr:hypothetical protein Tsubulata_019406 [Turnera subulata]